MYELNLGFQLMAYGLAGVFMVLILLYAAIVLIVKAFPYKEEYIEKDE